MFVTLTFKFQYVEYRKCIHAKNLFQNILTKLSPRLQWSYGALTLAPLWFMSYYLSWYVESWKKTVVTLYYKVYVKLHYNHNYITCISYKCLKAENSWSWNDRNQLEVSIWYCYMRYVNTKKKLSRELARIFTFTLFPMFWFSKSKKLF